jgi:hypothetical protein
MSQENSKRKEPIGGESEKSNEKSLVVKKQKTGELTTTSQSNEKSVNMKYCFRNLHQHSVIHICKNFFIDGTNNVTGGTSSRNSSKILGNPILAG